MFWLTGIRIDHRLKFRRELKKSMDMTFGEFGETELFICTSVEKIERRYRL
jgi:hypothetical protein